ncbi:MAG: hypothetical protein ACLFSY_01285 [Desulfonatronovibrionaceae bacterium]
MDPDLRPRTGKSSISTRAAELIDRITGKNSILKCPAISSPDCPGEVKTACAPEEGRGRVVDMRA